MLQDLFPKDHKKYQSSRFAAELEAFAEWLAAQGHLRHPLRLHLHRVRKVLDGCDRFGPGEMFNEEDLRQAFIVQGSDAYSGGGLGQAINRLFVAADVLDTEGRRPRVHDMRHSFAVQALMRWYRDGADVQSKLPGLAIYMGHVSIVSTAHYLHFLPAIRQLASDRFEAAFGDVVEEVST